jgi:hypothetical protein
VLKRPDILEARIAEAMREDADSAFGRARPSTNVLKARPLNSPKYKDSEAAKVIMGEIRASPPPISLNPNLEAALERWKKAAEGQGLLRSDQQDSQCSRQKAPSHE